MKRLQADLRRNRVLLALAGLAAVLGAILLQIKSLPIGMHFWDQIILVNAAYRMDLGLVPNADFVSPLGALPIFWFWLASHWPSHPNPLLGGQVLSTLAIFPAFLVAVWGRRAPTIAWLFIPFVIFGFLPFNSHWLGPTAADGGVMDAGVYNREGAIALYAFVALMFYARQRWRSGVFAFMLLVLFFTKISFAFAALLLFVIWASPSLHRRIEFAITIGIVLGALAILELSLHVVLSYLHDTVESFGAGPTDAYARAAFYVKRHFEVSFGIVFLSATLLLSLFRRSVRRVQRGSAIRSLAGFVHSNHSVVLVLCLLAGSIPLESQNTGTWDFIYLWPAMGSLIVSPLRGRPRDFARVGMVIVFAPIFLQTLYRTLWVLAAMTSGVPTTVLFPADFQTHIPTSRRSQDLMGRGLIDFDLMHAARSIYAENSAHGIPIEVVSSDDPPWHVAYLVSLQGTDVALRRILEARKAEQRRIVVLDAVDPFEKYFHLEPFRNLPYFTDPSRYLGGEALRSLRIDAVAADIVIVPQCPVTLARYLIAQAVAPRAFEGRNVVPLNECWTAYVKVS